MPEYLSSLSIPCPSKEAADRARARWRALAKPVGSLGRLEDLVTQIAALTGSERIDLSRRCAVIMCADNGVVAEGISASGPDVTAIIAKSIAEGSSSVCSMCAPIHTDCLAVDLGIFEPTGHPGVIDRRIAPGTKNIAHGPAMTREQAQEGIRAGIELVGDLARSGYRIVASGEMGIGNTTTATAMACALSGMDPARLCGPGTGLTPAGVSHKIAVVRQALAMNRPDPSDPLDVLSKVGGLDIAGMCGLCLGGAIHRVPIIVDGIISSVAAWCALELFPACRSALIASHLSSEPLSNVIAERTGLDPILHAGMHLGEGTGAVCLIPLLDMALSLYEGGSTLDAAGITSYKVEEPCASSC